MAAASPSPPPSNRRPCTCTCTCRSSVTSGNEDGQRHSQSSSHSTGTHRRGVGSRTPSNTSSGSTDPSQPLYSHHAIGNNNNLDASFVYLPPAPSSTAGAGGAGEILLYQIANGLMHENPSGGGGGLVGAARHAALLADVAEGRIMAGTGDDGDNDQDYAGASLCSSCVERITDAIDADTSRYEEETQAYVDAVAAEEVRERQIRQALSLNAEVVSRSGDQQRQQHLSGDELVRNAAFAFEEDIATLTEAVHEHERELEQLNGLLEEQVRRAAVLSREEDLLYMDQNDIEIDAAEFENVSRQLASRCSEAHCEVMALSKVNLHAALFEIAADDKNTDRDGTIHHQFPQINGMRLAHRPKGDLGWAEINCAWASAAQLLLFVGSTVKFASRDLRIVPMTSCAKIVEILGKMKYVHNLGRELDRGDGRNGSSGSSRSRSRSRRGSDKMIMVPSIRAFNALLFQVIQHILKEKGKSVRHPLPFQMTRSTIGSHDMMRLREEDSSSAVAAVIRCIAKNLEWLLFTVNSGGDPVPPE